RDHYISEWNERLSMSSSLGWYKKLKPSITISTYLEKLVNVKHRRAITKLRLSSHNLLIETGRHRQIERADRKCVYCNLNDIEDELHFILICPQYTDIRQLFIKKYYYTRPNMFKLVQLFNNENMTHLKNLAKYIIQALKHRNSLANEPSL
ncbi:MAG: hypothetical protein N0E48_26130, partial [Candidatus Thiodiazotropha endolucinida]|nr:hypothetical protein [Candidatus Thiodiazotropha taylori]MCW4346805.1 hypothetical protein [Candidatus Thiodiazotropha endolucinida]